MAYGIKLRVWGDYALFTRPEMKVERVSYDVITPSAARGIVEAIYWKPSIQWFIDKIYVCNPIEFTNFRRNEVKTKLLASNVKSVMNGSKEPLFLDTSKDRQQRASLVLKNVQYVIEAHFELTNEAGENDSVEKHYNIALRRLRKGQCYHCPSFGCREFPVNFELYEEENVKTAYTGEKDLGYMLFDMNYSYLGDIRPMLLRAVMREGVIDLTESEVIQ